MTNDELTKKLRVCSRAKCKWRTCADNDECCGIFKLLSDAAKRIKELEKENEKLKEVINDDSAND